ncbi:DNA-binding GntR family transcriptional regulator [Thermocatellispora tengchongensis]|uniref:DNA-binding GntR family transcriptional regulator n=1 Tax=Thermocatellispora tengchongensis TaxID=1073253 RepID=A0A840PHY4_9ACTN|nr:winged helix-turn-helix domain-containing protein [Thermocatellispora tengchongensis]MBB5138752.1 DNA-binding GntR family transcriptional regulator [Thermocatellispora tengchongensis]
MRTVREIVTGWRVYSQIADRLRRRITEGVYPPGSVLPSEAELCAEFGIARNTARRGLAVLEGEGLIVTIPAKGRIVAGGEATPYRYRQIADDLRAQIEVGEIAPGAAVPSEAELRERYAASRNTVRQALAVLQGEGLIVAEHGRGRFVRCWDETS